MKTWFQLLAVVFGSAAIAAEAPAKKITDPKLVKEYCDFAILSAVVPPKMPLSLVCRPKTTMIVDTELVEVDCVKHCKERGLK